VHPRLRRQLDAHLAAAAAERPALERLWAEVEAEYRRADQDHAALQHALALVVDLAGRTAPAPALAPAEPAAPRPRAGPVGRLRRQLFERAPFAAFICDPRLEVLAWNGSAERQFGYRAREAVGRELGDLLFPEVDRAALRRELQGLLERGEVDQSLRVAASKSGEARLDEWTVVPLPGEDGQPLGAAVLVREPFASDDRYAVAWQGTGDGLFDWDLRADRLWLSDTWLQLVGLPHGTGAPGDWLDRIHSADREGVQAAVRAHLAGGSTRFECEHRLRHEGGDWRWVLARAGAVRDPAGKAVRLCGSMMDVTERRAAADRVVHDALHDPLTRLPNRAMFLDLMKRCFARTRRREGYSFAVLFLDLDHFKSVNDGLGHAAGDDLLAQTARRLQTCLREGDTLARLGGDEFTVLVDDVKGVVDAEAVAERIRMATSLPFLVGPREVFSTVSVGIAVSSPAYGRPEDLLLDADTAMYRAKAQGRARCVVFDGNLRERTPQLLDLETDLRNALQRQEFRIQYLPVVDVATGLIQGLEALVRWAHPKRGMMAPDQFVPFAEETGLIVPIGRWLLQQAGRDLQRCRQATAAKRLMLHVNLSSKQLLQGDLLDNIDDVVKEHQMEPADLALELSESVLRQSEDSPRRLAQLHGRGVRLLMDDFGSGSSSLRSLHQFECDSVKIDRSLFSGGAPRGEAPELVRTIMTVARDMGKPVVAEGVETADQFKFLREMGCSAAQGYFFSPPVDGDAACSLLERRACW
jgi:diguanylate cyclase (GGDEF)-like protein/PAS domain S-box-containing protein